MSYCNGSWRIYNGNEVSKFAAPFLPNTINTNPTYGARDDLHGWFYHAAQSYFYTGNYWVKDWYKFVAQFRRGFLTSQQIFQVETYGVGYALAHTHQAIRITGDDALISEFARYFRTFLQPRQNKLYGSLYEEVPAEGYFMESIIDFMILAKMVDIQLYAELFNYLSGLMEWNLNTGNFGDGDSVSHLILISPQSWYFWHTGRIEFWNHIESYMNGLLGKKQKPYGSPWTTYPTIPDDFGRRNYIFVKQSMRQDLTPPSPIVDLVASFGTGSSIVLQWTGPATAVRYHAVWSDKPIVGTYSLDSKVSNWWAANALGINKVATPGIKESIILDIPYIQQALFFAMFSFDEVDNMSTISNVANIGVPPSEKIINIYPGDVDFKVKVESAISGDTIIIHEGDYFTDEYNKHIGRWNIVHQS